MALQRRRRDVGSEVWQEHLRVLAMRVASDVVPQPVREIGQRFQLVATIALVAEQRPEADVERIGLTIARHRGAPAPLSIIEARPTVSQPIAPDGGRRVVVVASHDQLVRAAGPSHRIPFRRARRHGPRRRLTHRGVITLDGLRPSPLPDAGQQRLIP